MVTALTKEVKAKLKLIYAILLIFEKFPLPRIKAFLTGCLLAMSKAPITPEVQLLLDRSTPVFGPVQAAVSVKSIDISGRSADVLAYGILKKMLPFRINLLKSKVIDLTLGNPTILKFLNLDNVDFYTKCPQSDIIENLTNLETKIIATPTLVTAIPLATALKTDFKNSLSAKSKKVIDIAADRTDITPLLIDAKFMLIRNFGNMNDFLFENLAAVVNYFPYEDMSHNTHLPDYLSNNQYKVTGIQGAAINVIEAEFENNHYLQVDCRKCPIGAYVFLASDITNVIPLNAQKVCKGDRLIFKFDTIGSTTQKYLMVVFATDETVTEECNIILTIDTTKPKRKNIVAPIVETPAPIVVVTPTPTVVDTNEPTDTIVN